MSEYQKPGSEEEFSSNFEQIHPLMNDTQAYYESSRCLFCYDAPCIKACPTGIDIPLFIKQISTGNVSGSALTIYHSNWLGNICGKVCPTAVLCEGACVYNHQEVKPIEIGRLQSYATTHAIKRNMKLSQPQSARTEKIAVVGAGPAGVSAACELSQMGYQVTVFEAKDYPSGLALYGVAPYKIKNEEILEEINFLQEQFGFQIHYNHQVHTEEDFLQLENQFSAIFLGVGLGATQSLGIKGEQLTGSWGAVEFIERLKIEHQDFEVGERVVVLGGGNTAMDAASEAARMGAREVVLAYRRGPTEMGAYEFEFDLVKSVGVKSMWFVNPVEIIGNQQVSGVKFVSTVLENGRLKELENSEFIYPCDMVIRATGQEKQRPLLSSIKGLETDSFGRIVQGSMPFQTTNPRYFAAGDAFNGGLEVVNAVAEAKQAAQSIHQYLKEIV